jgi:cysteine desulfurase
VARQPPVRTAHRVYLDHAAATPVRSEVTAAIVEAEAVAFANPSSPHAAGRLAKRILEESRERILALAGCRTTGQHRDRLVFTSGATEANRLGVLGLAGDRPGWIAGSARDHPGLRQAATDLGARGWQATELPLTAAGCLQQGLARDGFAAAAVSAGLLTVTTICGQTGIREDLAGIARLAHDVSAVRFHADATQAAAWEPLGFAESPFATLAFAPHKFGGPRGIGGLMIRSGVPLRPIVAGPQELGLRGGTEAVALAVGFARSFELAVTERERVAARVAALRNRFEREIVAAAAAAGFVATVIGADTQRAPHVAAFGIRGIDRQVLVIAADLEGVCLASGTACASGSPEPPAVLAALGIDRDQRLGVVRASLGETTTEADVGWAVARMAAVFARLRG